MIISFLIGFGINAVIFIVFFYLTKTFGFLAYPFLLPIVCSVTGYKTTKKLWFGFVSFFLIQILYFGIYETIENMAGNSSFWKQLYLDYFSNVDGRWALSLHILALLISVFTSVIIYWRVKSSI